MRTGLQIQGLDALVRNLQSMPERVSRSVLKEVLKTAGAPPIQARAAALAPRAPGAPDLADHIVISPSRSPRSAAVVMGPAKAPRSDQPGVRYDQQGRFLEFGTVDTPMQAFMRPAFDSTAPSVIAPIGFALWRAIVGRGFSTRGSDTGGGLT